MEDKIITALKYLAQEIDNINNSLENKNPWETRHFSEQTVERILKGNDNDKN